MLPGAQSHGPQEDRQQGTIQDTRKEAGKGTAVRPTGTEPISEGVWTRFAQVLGPLFPDALGPYLAPCCQEKV